MDQFVKVLALNPDKDNKLLATQNIASIYYQQKDWDHAEEWNRKVIEQDPTNKGGLLHARRAFLGPVF